jgi:hypothetical protein
VGVGGQPSATGAWRWAWGQGGKPWALGRGSGSVHGMCG